MRSVRILAGRGQKAVVSKLYLLVDSLSGNHGTGIWESVEVGTYRVNA